MKDDAFRLDGFNGPLAVAFEKLPYTYWSFYEGWDSKTHSHKIADLQCESKEELLEWLDNNRRSDRYTLVVYDDETSEIIYREDVDLETSFIPENAIWQRDPHTGVCEGYSLPRDWMADDDD